MFDHLEKKNISLNRATDDAIREGDKKTPVQARRLCSEKRAF
jgi:hypothetical protein